MKTTAAPCADEDDEAAPWAAAVSLLGPAAGSSNEAVGASSSGGVNAVVAAVEIPVAVRSTRSFSPFAHSMSSAAAARGTSWGVKSQGGRRIIPIRTKASITELPKSVSDRSINPHGHSHGAHARRPRTIRRWIKVELICLAKGSREWCSHTDVLTS